MFAKERVIPPGAFGITLGPRAARPSQASDEILDTYEVERAQWCGRWSNSSRRFGSIITPTSRIVAAARDSVFACLNLSGRFRAFIGRGGGMPPPAIHRGALTATGKDRLIGQMAPQATITSSHGDTPLDQFLDCHQWLARRRLEIRQELFLHGTGARPFVYRVTRGLKARLVGLGLLARSFDDLQKLSKAALALESKVDHVAFEVVDLDAVEMGQQVMMARQSRLGRRAAFPRQSDLRLLARSVGPEARALRRRRPVRRKAVCRATTSSTGPGSISGALTRPTTSSTPSSRRAGSSLS